MREDFRLGSKTAVVTGGGCEVCDDSPVRGSRTDFEVQP